MIAFALAMLVAPVLAAPVAGPVDENAAALAPVLDKDLPQELPVVPDAPHARYLKGDFLPARVFPAPPAKGSAEEARERDEMRRLIAAAPRARIAQAAIDGKAENPTAFSAALGHDLRSLPQTWALLTIVETETDVVIEQGKLFFARPRPYVTDPTLPTCIKADPNKPAKAYPSGHAGFGYSTAWALARLVPERAGPILDRAEDYALSRRLCGVHYPSDTAASHPVAVLIAQSLLDDPALATQVAKARAELAAAGLTH